jgi:hypothetical protein
MKEREVNGFAWAKLDFDIQLRLARDLERLYTSVLEEPLPEELREFIDRLERALLRQRAATET